MGLMYIFTEGFKRWRSMLLWTDDKISREESDSSFFFFLLRAWFSQVPAALLPFSSPFQKAVPLWHLPVDLWCPIHNGDKALTRTSQGHSTGPWGPRPAKSSRVNPQFTARASRGIAGTCLEIASWWLLLLSPLCGKTTVVSTGPRVPSPPPFSNVTLCPCLLHP